MLPIEQFPMLETSRLRLRKMELTDKEDLFQMQSDPKMCEHSDSRPETDLEGTVEYITRMNSGMKEGKWLIWAIEHLSSRKVIGTVCIWNFCKTQKMAELGYGIIPDFRGMGLMNESLRAVIDYSFLSLKLDALDAYTEENNHPSIQLLQRCGFHEVDRVIDEGFYQKRDFHMVVFRLNNAAK